MCFQRARWFGGFHYADAQKNVVKAEEIQFVVGAGGFKKNCPVKEFMNNRVGQALFYNFGNVILQAGDEGGVKN
jgi:hypothetical protein